MQFMKKCEFDKIEFDSDRYFHIFNYKLRVGKMYIFGTSPDTEGLVKLNTQTNAVEENNTRACCELQKFNSFFRVKEIV